MTDTTTVSDADVTVSDMGDTPAILTVAQEIHDALIADFDKAKAYIAELEGRMNVLAEHNLNTNEALVEAARARDDAHAELTALKTEPNSTGTMLAAPTVHETVDDEVEAIKVRLHALADEGKAVTSRLADISPGHIARTIESAAHSFKALLAQVL